MSASNSVRVLVDVSHPSHVHLFRHAIQDLEAQGHEVVVASREKGITTDLLDAYDVDHRPVSRQRSSRFRLLPEWAVREYKLVRLARAFEPDVVVSQFTPWAVHAAHVAGARSLVFTDDETAIEAVGQLTCPFATAIYTPRSFTTDLGPKHRRYRGYHQLAYLHPNRFEPDPDRLRSHGVDPTSRFFVLRFVTRPDQPEVAEAGFSDAARRDLVGYLARRGDVYVAADDGLPDDSAAQAIPVPPEHVHHLLAAADLYAGDSRTMALEAGILGTPTVGLTAASTAVFGHLQELESRYSLVLSYDAEDEAVVEAKNLAADPMAPERWAERRTQMLSDVVDVTSFMVETITHQGTREEAPTRGIQTQGPTHELA